MNSIWKYQLEVERRQIVYMPVGAKIVSLGVQNEYPVMWVSVDTDAEPKARIFTLVTTGERYEPQQAVVGTVTIREWFVAHILDGAVRVGGGDKELDLKELQSELKVKEPSAKIVA